MTTWNHQLVRLTLSLSIGLLLHTVDATARPPTINTVYPTAAQRGVDSSIQCVGKGLASADQLIVPFKAEIRRGGSNPDSVRFQIKPAADTPPGFYPLRVRSPEGISNLRLFAVTDVPVVRAKEPNGVYKNGRIQLDSAQAIEWPAVIAGGRLSQDFDLFRFSVSAGQRLLIVTETRRLGLTPDPIIRLRDSNGRTLAIRHDTIGLRADERLDYRFERSGDYYIELRSVGVAGWNNHYLLKIGSFDYARTVFPLGGRRGEKVHFSVLGSDGTSTKIEAQVPKDPWPDRWQLPLPNLPGSLPWTMASGDLPEVLEDSLSISAEHERRVTAWPVTINGRIGKSGEGDLYRMVVKPGQQIRVNVEAFFLGSFLDGHLIVYDPAAKKILAKNDDKRYRGNPDPDLKFDVPDNTNEVVIALRDSLGRGGIEFAYRMTIERGGDDFYLWLGKPQGPYSPEGGGWFKMDASDTLNLPIGKEVKLTVSARRIGKDDTGYGGALQGFQGPIRVKAVGVPLGVTIQPATMRVGQKEIQLTCFATAAAPREPFEIAIVGEGVRKDGSIIHRVAERRLYLADAQMTILPWNWRVRKLTCVTAIQPASVEVKK